VKLIADTDALLDETEAMQRRLFSGVECERRRRDDNEEREQIITEEYRRYRTGHRDNTKRPIPIRVLRVMVIFSPFPF
jgi:hypothetical protein